MASLRTRRAWPLGLPGWLLVGLLTVAGVATAALIMDKELWAVVATAAATALLAIFTAQLYSASIAQLRASSRPLLVEVKPYAPPPPDLAIWWGPDKRNPDSAGPHPYYDINFPDGFSKKEWDGRRAFVHAVQGEPLRVSVIVRNVGLGLALIKVDSVNLEHAGHPTVKLRHVRYPRLPAGESTRINLVAEPVPSSYRGPIKLVIGYTDLSGTHEESAHLTLEYQQTGAWTRDAAGGAWQLTDVRYVTSGLVPLQ